MEGNPSLTSANFWSLPGSLGVLWCIVASLQSLPLVSHGLLLCVCVRVRVRVRVRVCVCVCVCKNFPLFSFMKIPVLEFRPYPDTVCLK